MGLVQISGHCAIPEEELSFTAARSGGPGGQNVNKVSSRVTLHFDVGASLGLSLEQKSLLHERLATRINSDGILRVVAQQHRSQLMNREAAVARFIELLNHALQRKKPRRRTAVPRAVRQKRLESKSYRSELKKLRSLKADMG